MVGAPSERSFTLAAALPPTAAEGSLPDAAFSMVAKTFLLCYGIWDSDADDAANEAWFQRLVGSVEPLSIGHYIAEANLPAGPSRSVNSYAPTNWTKLQALRRQYDPGRMFHSYLAIDDGAV
jgi:FAD/FMN-containing dehydrogenase